MSGHKRYHTKQGKSLLAFLQQHSGEHFHRKELCQRLKQEEIAVGETTVWRYLEQLCQEGKVRKSSPDGKSVCYTYGCCDGNHYHLQCTRCKRLIHLDCPDFDRLREHVLSEHGFFVDPLHTTVCGVCRDCQSREVRL